MYPRPLQEQVNDVAKFALWLGATAFLFMISREVGRFEKNLLNTALDVFTPEELPVRIPQTTLVEGGEPVPPQYRHLVGWISEPLPEYSLLTLLPAVEAGERKIDAVLKQLKSGVENIQDSYQYRLFLTTMSKFHAYSIGNLILIALQKPGATKVAGYNTWRDMERWVKPGEKGIAILAPIFPPRATCSECGARIPKGTRFCPKCGESVEIEIEVSPRYFKVVHVFDINQTEGKPLLEFEVPVLTGEVNEELFGNLLALTKAKDVTVSFESRPYLEPDIKGQYSPPAQIWVRPEEPRAQQLKTLCHEVAHYYSEGVFRISRRDAETIAESAAYVVGAHFGFDSGVRSFPYMALWARDRKVLEANLGAVRRVATTILEELEKAGSSSQELELLPQRWPTLVIDGWRVWLRGAYADKYRTVKDLELAREREAARVEKFNPRLAQRLREMTLLEWLQQGGAITRKERV